MNWPVIAVGAPGVALIAGLALSLALAAGGRSPIWPDHQLTLSEAIAAESDADIAVLMARGDNLNIAYDVRAGLLSDRPARLTPLETAVEARRADLINYLVVRGAVIDTTVWHSLRCRAGDADVAEALDRLRPGGAILRCGEAAP